ncbi:MAG: low molecular weight phosphotyrosine protein phosphatase [Lachnospiraceae bacterium]|nr:low molecular weight phosphotyrosine protein phosphatase [Lachnospiraceae bacterium]
MIKVLFICHGNICRSPMAEFVMKDMVRKIGLEKEFYIASAATSTEEIDNDIHYGTRRKLREVGIPTSPRRAVQLTKADYMRYDYLIAMDSWNVRNILRIVGADPQKKVSLLLEFAGLHRDIADPWYTGNFDATYDDVCKGCQALLEQILAGNME